ncbi:GNAT family N-acetyltransferase [Clostridium ihumii]|uniref:GNAT family N-acetyltransferase n=1 Tax=Clostridium ihumii TaxID=1470356 RepID=UPI003D33B63E
MGEGNIENYNVSIVPVKKEHACFINEIANNEELMKIFHDNHTNIADWKEAIRIWLADKDEIDFIIVTKNDKTPIGWVGINGLESKDKNVWIKMIAILPSYWSKNYGSNTIKIIKNELKKRGYKRISLWTDEDNVRAQLCYKANNFKIIDKKKDTVGNKEIIKERLLMECCLL